MTEVSFPDAVAERSGHAVADVIRVLSEARVPTTDTVGAPHRLRVHPSRIYRQEGRSAH